MVYYIRGLYLNIFSEKLISYVAIRLTKFFNEKDVYASMMGVSSMPSMDRLREITVRDAGGAGGNGEQRVIYFDAFPRFITRFIYRLLSNQIRTRFAEWRYFRSIAPGDIAYLYPGCSLGLLTKLKQKGCVIVAERINTLRWNSKIILDAEYERLNLERDYDISDASVLEEITKMQLVDYIFSPSPAVGKSIEQAGISTDKVIATSYGLDENDILDVPFRSNCVKPLNVLFAGRICVRKGVHLLLSAWKRAKINGELLLIGNIDQSFSSILDEYKADPSIRHVPFVEDLKPYYSNADLFVLPSLEEGSPLVTYLALGAALPMIVSSMGGGGVVQDGKEAIIIDPHNKDQFADALKSLAADTILRKRMAKASKKTAAHYTWGKVAKRRSELLFKKLKYDRLGQKINCLSRVSQAEKGFR